MSAPNQETANFSALSAESVIARLQSSADGLSDGEAQLRLASCGHNELDTTPSASSLSLLADQLRNRLILILLAATLVSLFAGHGVEALAIMIIVGLSVALGFIQDYRADRAMAALRQLTAPTATVLRSGAATLVPTRDLVVGDILLLQAGNLVPADARLIEAVHLQTQEAVLTGESLPVEKHCRPLPAADLPPPECTNMVFAGTSVTRGRGRGIVVATGMRSQFGRIAGLLRTVSSGRTPLQESLDALGRILANAALGIVAIIVAAGVLRGQPFVEMLVFGIALAVAVVPEALPAVVTISLAIGVQRLVRKNSLIRRLAAVETLGSVSVICTDKTGTLTRDEMTARLLLVSGKVVEIPGTGLQPTNEGTIACRPPGPAEVDDPSAQLVRQLLQAGALVCDAQLDTSADVVQANGDPTERAIVCAAAQAGIDKAELDRRFPRVGEIPFSPEARRMTSLHRDGAGYVEYTKGATEAVLPSCGIQLTEHGEMALDVAARSAIMARAQEMAGRALRVLAVAMARRDRAQIVGENMVFLGLIGMIDPPRPEAHAAVHAALAAGIRVIMVTGDHPLTAAAIAGELGMARADGVITGRDLSAMNDAQFAEAIERSDVFARVEPRHKLRIVAALQERGHVVAMTGDGVNDAPALKKADIGVAMGINGTDVARDAAAMTLLDDNFSSILAAVAEGRGIFANIKKYLAFVLSCNIGEIGLMAAVALLGLPLPLTSVQILYVNLATDGLIALAIAVDPYEGDLMRMAPRNPRQGILSGPVLALILAGGLWSTAVNLAIFTWMLEAQRPLAEAMTVTFVSLVLIQFFKAYAFRSCRLPVVFSPFANRWLNLAIIWETVLLLAVVYSPVLHLPFGTVGILRSDWLVIVGASLTVIPVLELCKWLIRRSENRAWPHAGGYQCGPGNGGEDAK